MMMLLPVRGRIRKYRKFRRRGQSNGEEEDDDDDGDETDVDIEKCGPAKGKQPEIEVSFIRFSLFSVKMRDFWKKKY